MIPSFRFDLGGHLSPEEIRSASLRSRPERAYVARRMRRLALHLALDCPQCWRAAEQARPAPRDPVAGALLRLARPGTWPGLRHDYLHALRTARRRPFGFARLVIEEAWVPTGLRRFTETLARAAPGRREIADVAVLASCRQGDLQLRRRARKQAAVQLREARALLPETTGDPLPHARTLELAAKLCLCARQFEAAERLLLEAADLLGPEHAGLRFELRSVAALPPALPEERRLAHFALALADLDRLRQAADPVDRLYALCSRARTMVTLLAVAPDVPWPGYDDTLSQLADAESLFSEHADPHVLCEALMNRARLLRLTDPVAALNVYLRALEGWTEIGDVEPFMAAVNETTALQRILGRNENFALLTVLETVCRRVEPEIVLGWLRRFMDQVENIDERES